MPPSHYQTRDLDPGVTFSFVFAAVAGSVVIACVIWGFAIPKWRKRHQASPSNTKWNEGSILTQRNKLRHFPSRPTIKPLLSKPSAAQVLPTYNPRTESPFPDSPSSVRSDTPNSMEVPVRMCSAPTMSRELSSNGLFTPVRTSEYRLDTLSQCHTMPRATYSKYFDSRSIEFGDTEDFILAIPEPLVLRPRSAGRPAAVTRHLEKYGSIQTVSPAGSDRMLHSKKLFQALQRLDQRSSLCSTTSLRIDHRESDAVYAETQIADTLNQALREDARMRRQMRKNSDDSGITTLSAVSQDSKNSRMTTIHRARSYKSLTGSKTSKIARGGTVSKPKTPVLELKKLYSQQEDHKTIESMPKLPSTSTGMTVTSDHGTSFGSDTVSTAETSPTFARLPATTFGLSLQDKQRSVNQPEQSPDPPLTHQAQLRIRVRASSLYSRDTHGHSLTTTPLTLDFPSPVFDYFTGQELTNPYKGHDSVKDRINHWNQFLDQENESPMPLSPTPNTFPTIHSETNNHKNSTETKMLSATSDQQPSIKRSLEAAQGDAAWI